MIELLPHVNASLNSLATIFLVLGFFHIRRGNVTAHRASMMAAFVASSLFLACYLTYHVNTLSKPFPGTGGWRTVYFSILIPHIILAVAVLPFIFVTFARAFWGQYQQHKKIARWTLPVWLYVSVTGVVVYLMLYQIRW